MAKILVVGNITLDIVHQLARYPREDEECRAEARWQRRGGNAANTAVVLAQHGHQVSFAGTLGSDDFARTLLDDLDTNHVDHVFCQQIQDKSTPISCINLSRASGSRTIVHYRDLPEFSREHFDAIPLEDFDWYHFEGRNLPTLQYMLGRVSSLRVDQPVSLEVEKARPGIEMMFADADLLIFSRAYARIHGFDSAAGLFDHVAGQSVAGGMLVCSWGEDGAYARNQEGGLIHQPALPIERICDSTGAGDTFNAGLIHSLLSGRPLATALEYANQLAARKLQQQGDARLVD